MQHAHRNGCLTNALRNLDTMIPWPRMHAWLVRGCTVSGVKEGRTFQKSGPHLHSHAFTDASRKQFRMLMHGKNHCWSVPSNKILEGALHDIQPNACMLLPLLVPQMDQKIQTKGNFTIGKSMHAAGETAADLKDEQVVAQVVQLAHVAVLGYGRRQVRPVYQAPLRPLAQKILPAQQQQATWDHEKCSVPVHSHLAKAFLAGSPCLEATLVPSCALRNCRQNRKFISWPYPGSLCNGFNLPTL